MDKRIGVVTGANRGIGLEICRQLADAGLCVVLTSRDESKGKAALDGLGKSDQELCFHQPDVTDDDSFKTLAAYLKTELGRLDVLVNNAGIVFENDRSASVLEQSAECFHAPTGDSTLWTAAMYGYAIWLTMRRSITSRPYWDADPVKCRSAVGS